MNIERRKAILEQACRDEELVAELPPVVAAGFGVIPLRRLGDVLTVACFPRANRQALRVLRDVLELEVVATPFEDRLLHEAIRQAYFPADETVNFPTFLDPAFLEEAGSAVTLREEKHEQPGEVHVEQDPAQLTLLSLTYRSTLANLDGESRGRALPDPSRTRLELGDLDLGWRRDADGRPRLYLEELPPDALAVVSQFRLTDYLQLQGGGHVGEHLTQVDTVTALPLVIHPTEVQLVGLLADGSVEVHVYDQPQRFAPGQAGRFGCDYYFLSYGNVMRRSIEVELHDVERVARADLQRGAGSAPWSGRELGRWFGLRS